MNSQPGKLSVLPGRVETGGVTPVFYAEPLLLRLYPPDGRKTFALTGRCRPRFRRPCSVQARSEGMTSPLSVERRACRSGRLPDRDDETSPQTGVVAAVVFLIHVCGQIGLQDDRTKALTDQSTDGDLALLQVTINRRIWPSDRHSRSLDCSRSMRRAPGTATVADFP